MLSPIFFVITVLNLGYLNHIIFAIDFLAEFIVLIIIHLHACQKEKHMSYVRLFQIPKIKRSMNKRFDEEVNQAMFKEIILTNQAIYYLYGSVQFLDIIEWNSVWRTIMGMFNIARCIISELHSQKGIQIRKPQAHSCNSQMTRSQWIQIVHQLLQDKRVTPLHISANKGNIHCYESCVKVSDLQEFGGANTRNNVSLYNLADLIKKN